MDAASKGTFGQYLIINGSRVELSQIKLSATDGNNTYASIFTDQEINIMDKG
jgi:hypothetical protein